MKEMLIGIFASLFFAVTFIVNRSMELGGGHWMWSSSLRFFFMLPFLVLIIAMSGSFSRLANEMRSQPAAWVLWSTVGFGLFYAPLTFAAASGPAWLVAGTWQLTIVAGLLTVPLFKQKVLLPDGSSSYKRQQIHLPALTIASFIVAGVLLIQFQQFSGDSGSGILLAILPVLIAAFAYPLGNRKMMALLNGRLSTFERILGMVIASLPVWILLSILAYREAGWPAGGQILQCLIVALCSGVIATALFFIATDRSRQHPGRLAAVEATQSAQIIFVMFGEIWLFSSPYPQGLAIAGLIMIMAGMIGFSFVSRPRKHATAAR